MIKDIITNQSDTNNILYERCHEFEFDSEEPWFGPDTVGDRDKIAAAEIVQDLLDTAESVRKKCLGMSANQIGYNRRVFVFRVQDGGPFVPVINPVLIRTGGGVKALFEQCLSRVDEDGAFLPGIRVRRPKEIGVEFFDVLSETVIRLEIKGLRARVFLHELDHLNGKEI